MKEELRKMLEELNNTEFDVGEYLQKLVDLFDKHLAEYNNLNNIKPKAIILPTIGSQYWIPGNERNTLCKVVDYHDEKGKILVKWDDGEVTLETITDKRRSF